MANIVGNPDFASPSNGAYTAIPNWMPIDNNPAVVYTNGSGNGNYGSGTGYYYMPYHNTGSQTNGNGFWDNGTAPNGVATVAEIQTQSQPATGNTLSQTLSLVVGATYLLSYYENARQATGSSSGLWTVEALVGGVDVIGPHSDYAVGGSNPFNRYAGSFVATSSQETLTFDVKVVNQFVDGAALLTAVDVSQVPEPYSIALLTSAAAGMGLLRQVRRRRSN